MPIGASFARSEVEDQSYAVESEISERFPLSERSELYNPRFCGSYTIEPSRQKSENTDDGWKNVVRSFVMDLA